MKLLIALTLLTATASFAGGPPATKHSGWVTDSMCNVKHAGADKKDVACVTKCIKGGEKPVFVDDANQKIYAIDNPDAVKTLYGEHVSIDTNGGAAASSIYIIKAKVLAD